jgi:hypothetical protein
MLVRYQAEDKPTTIEPAEVNRGVSALVQGDRTAIVPPDSERLLRRRRKNLKTISLKSVETPSCENAGCGSDKELVAAR